MRGKQRADKASKAAAATAQTLTVGGVWPLHLERSAQAQAHAGEKQITPTELLVDATRQPIPLKHHTVR